MTKREQLIDLIQNMHNFDLIQLHNEYCYNTNNYDDEIFSTDMFDEIMQGLTPWDIATKIRYGEFNPTDEFFKFNGYGNIQTISEYELDRYIEIVDIVDYILEKDEDFDNNDIRYILDDIEEA